MPAPGDRHRCCDFLQGQFTNDLRDLGPGSAVYGLWLDRRGRVIADSHVLRDPGDEAFWVASLSSPSSVVGRHFGDHIIADDVEVADETGGWRASPSLGTGSRRMAGRRAAPGAGLPGPQDLRRELGMALPRGRIGTGGRGLSGARVRAAGEVERLRIESAIPSVPADIGPATSRTRAGSMSEAVSYSQGLLPWAGGDGASEVQGPDTARLERVTGGGPPPAVPAGLWRGAPGRGSSARPSRGRVRRPGFVGGGWSRWRPAGRGRRWRSAVRSSRRLRPHPRFV